MTLESPQLSPLWDKAALRIHIFMPQPLGEISIQEFGGLLPVELGQLGNQMFAMHQQMSQMKLFQHCL